MKTKIYDIVSELELIPGRNDKEAYLAKLEGNEFWKQIVYYTYNPYFNFGVVNIDQELFDEDKTKFTEGFDINGEFFILLDKLRNREVTGNAAHKAIADYISNVDFETAVVLELVLARDLDVGCGIKTFNKVYGKQFIPVFEVMLADSGEISYPCYIEQKYDGIRFEAVVENRNVTFYTRNGNTTEFPIIAEQILNLVDNEDCVLCGEIEGKDRKSVSGQVNKFLKNTAQTPADRDFIFYVFDILKLSEFKAMKHLDSLHIRIGKRNSLFADFNFPNLCNVESVWCENAQDMQEAYRTVIKSGGEGLIAKNPHAPYRHKRCTDWIKVKAVRDCDLTVIGVTEGFGKRANLFGALICSTSDRSMTVNVGSGLTDQILEELSEGNPIGLIVTVTFNQLICNEQGDISLFLPRLKEIRGDKKVADSLERILKTESQESFIPSDVKELAEVKFGIKVS